MSRAALPCTDGSPSLLLVELRAAHSMTAARLSEQRYRVTQTDCALELFLMQEIFRFTIAVLNDEIGTPFLCSAAASVRWQWPLARILILGKVPAAMNDQLYDEVVLHSADAKTLCSAIDQLGEDPWDERSAPLPPGICSDGPLIQAKGASERWESDPTKVVAIAPPGVPGRDLPADQNRSHRRGYYAFPPAS